MLKRLFGFDPVQTTIKKEILAGITTLLTMSYILAVNPEMFRSVDCSRLMLPRESYTLYLQYTSYQDNEICEDNWFKYSTKIQPYDFE
jgi:xanthine/uracil/vitamin C permease (AzgA family)